ncbi:hypothetical protein QT971_15160, partial [Microcoleus sp. herbarium19]|uniref:hypothetical protein n=1 Tax=unclassified Microcoleus TaxID=2642155 RepID=UPI002FD0F843
RARKAVLEGRGFKPSFLIIFYVGRKQKARSTFSPIAPCISQILYFVKSAKISVTILKLQNAYLA